MTLDDDLYGVCETVRDLSDDLEAAETYTLTEECRFCFVRAGPSDAKAILFLPGLGATWRAWTSTINRLASSFDCVAIDIPGFGGSTRPVDGMSVDSVTTAINSFVANQVRKPVTVVAHSLGGLVATHMQLGSNPLIAGLALVSGVFPVFLEAYEAPLRILREPDQYGIAAVAMAASALPLRVPLERALRRSAVTRRLALRPFVERPDLISAEAAADLAVGGSIASIAGVLRNGFGYDYGHVMSSLADPLIIHGANDRLSTTADVQRVLDLCPTAAVVVIKGARHAPMVEYPSVVSDLLIEWLSRKD